MGLPLFSRILEERISPLIIQAEIEVQRLLTEEEEYDVIIASLEYMAKEMVEKANLEPLIKRYIERVTNEFQSSRNK